MTSFCHLPKEALEEILLRVPPKSLVSCKRVCKLWYAVINDQSFINRQLQISINDKRSSSITLALNWTRHGRPLNGKRVSRVDGKRILSVVTVHDKDEGDSDQLPCAIEEINLPVVPETEEKYFPMTFVGCHCNGIMCFHSHYYGSVDCESFLLCNPVLGEFKLIRTPFIPSFMFAGAGFGYDPKFNDYKCFKLLSGIGKNITRAFVHVLGTDFWREIDFGLNRCYLSSEGVYCNGFYYWWNMGYQYSEQMILSFDLSEEEFHEIQPPKCARDSRRERWNLALWKESVVCFARHSLSLDMWVMNNYSSGVDSSTHWTKLLTVGPLVSIISPLSFWKDDELLIQTRDEEIVSYNLHSRRQRKLPLRGLRGLHSHAYLYTPSLVSIRKRQSGDAKGKKRGFNILSFNQEKKEEIQMGDHAYLYCDGWWECG